MNVLEEVYMGSAVCVITELLRECICPSQQPLVLCFGKRWYYPFNQWCGVLHVVYSHDLLYDDPKLAHGSECMANVVRRWMGRRECVKRGKIIGMVARNGEVGWILDRWLRKEAGTKPARVSVLPTDLGLLLAYDCQP